MPRKNNAATNSNGLLVVSKIPSDPRKSWNPMREGRIPRMIKNTPATSFGLPLSPDERLSRAVIFWLGSPSLCRKQYSVVRNSRALQPSKAHFLSPTETPVLVHEYSFLRTSNLPTLVYACVIMSTLVYARKKPLLFLIIRPPPVIFCPPHFFVIIRHAGRSPFLLRNSAVPIRV